MDEKDDMRLTENGSTTVPFPSREPTYYAKDGIVWKSPIRTAQPNGGMSISLGFPVCTMHDATEGQEAVVAEMLNQSEFVDDLLEALKQLRLNYVAALNASGAAIDQRSVLKADAAIAKAEAKAPPTTPYPDDGATSDSAKVRE